MDVIEKGGVIMVLIIILSIIATVIVIERLLYFQSRKYNERKLISEFKAQLSQGNYKKVLSLCITQTSPLSRLIRIGIRYRKHSVSEMREMVRDAINLETPYDERFLSALGTIAHIAPLLGLLGTVTGNIEAFGVLGNLQGMSDPAILSKGISEALLTTAAGIIVSIPAVIFYNHLIGRVSNRIISLEYQVSELVTMFVSSERQSITNVKSNIK